MFAEGTFQDPHNARLLYLASGGLLLLGLALGIGTWLWWRSSKVEHPALGPLEVMSQRSWRTDEFVAQRRRLDEARPEGAQRQFVPPVEIELDVDARQQLPHFDDLAAGDDPRDELPDEPAPDERVPDEPVPDVPVVERAVSDPLLRAASDAEPSGSGDNTSA